MSEEKEHLTFMMVVPKGTAEEIVKSMMRAMGIERFCALLDDIRLEYLAMREAGGFHAEKVPDDVSQECGDRAVPAEATAAAEVDDRSDLSGEHQPEV
jgi:hypothetical protein